MNPIMNFKVAQLNDYQFSRIKSLENKLNCVIVAYNPASEPLQLEEETLKRVQEMEKELGVMLIAYPSTFSPDSSNRNALGDNQLRKIKELETQLGKIIIPNSKLPVAELSEQEMEEINALQHELKLTLIAYDQILPGTKFAQLTGELRAKFDAFAKELGCSLVALEPTMKLAQLSLEELKKVNELEKELQDTLFVFDPGNGGTNETNEA